MSFDTYFRLTSYATIGAAALALLVGGGVGIWLATVFILIMIVGWKLEGSKWQFSERFALVIILAALPIFYLDWRILTPYLELQYLETGKRSSVEVTVLAHLILFLSAVKLLQRKTDRDWFFLYLISFFEVLLAAGLTVSPIFLATLIVYLLCALSTVVAFEIQKSRRKVTATRSRLLVPPDSTLFQKLPMRLWRRRYLETRRLPLVSVGLLVFIVVLAFPFFLIAPRTASSAFTRSGSGLAGFIGFSDNVTLGEIGHLKSSDEIFMHVRLEDIRAVPASGLRWRGVALDEFTGRAWKKSNVAERFSRKENDRGLFQVGTTSDPLLLTVQTFYLEAVDTPVLFGAPRIVAVQGRLPFVGIDSEGAIQTRQHEEERLVYKVFSDTSEPSPTSLRTDRFDYQPQFDFQRYTQLPTRLDPRVAALTRDVTVQAGAQNRYDQARAIESFLRERFAYSLDLKATGPDPLADFLFHVRSGHCEYFATAMVVMLRTQGVAARVVNGFLPGEFNEASGAFTVRQSDAHSWVEVYFPETRSWVTFDPTPPQGRAPKVRTGLAAQLSKYTEALELMWFQYVVGYDKQEQSSLASRIRRGLFELQRNSGNGLDRARSNLGPVLRPLILGVTLLLVLVLLGWVARRVHRMGWGRGLRVWQTDTAAESSPVEFYERLVRALEKQGVKRESHQTPLEFASAIQTSEAQLITHAYNRVRYGAQSLSASEQIQIEEALSQLEAGKI
jgi:protein-glutamine gamma-glutamyltransferase